MERFRQTLLALQAELAATAEESADAARPVELDQPRVGRLSRMDALHPLCRMNLRIRSAG